MRSKGLPKRFVRIPHRLPIRPTALFLVRHHHRGRPVGAPTRGRVCVQTPRWKHQYPSITAGLPSVSRNTKSSRRSPSKDASHRSSFRCAVVGVGADVSSRSEQAWLRNRGCFGERHSETFDGSILSEYRLHVVACRFRIVSVASSVRSISAADPQQGVSSARSWEFRHHWGLSQGSCGLGMDFDPANFGRKGGEEKQRTFRYHDRRSRYILDAQLRSYNEIDREAPFLSSPHPQSPWSQGPHLEWMGLRPPRGTIGRGREPLPGLFPLGVLFRWEREGKTSRSRKGRKGRGNVANGINTMSFMVRVRRTSRCEEGREEKEGG